MADFVLVRYAIYAEGELAETNDPEVDPKAKDKLMLIKIGEGFFPKSIEERLKEEDLVEAEIGEEENPYGAYDRSKLKIYNTKDLTRILKRRPKAGDTIRVGNEIGVVIHSDARQTIVDFNHPLAGKKLKYVVKVVKRLEDKHEIVKRLMYDLCDAIEPESVSVEGDEELIITLPEKRRECPLADLVATHKLKERDLAKKLERRKPVDLSQL